LTVFS